MPVSFVPKTQQQQQEEQQHQGNKIARTTTTTRLRSIRNVMFLFIFATQQRSSRILEENIGPCQFCINSVTPTTTSSSSTETVPLTTSTPCSSTVDLIEHYSEWHAFGLIPAGSSTDRLVACRQCGKIVKENYYTLRNVVPSCSGTVPADDYDTNEKKNGDQHNNVLL